MDYNFSVYGNTLLVEIKGELDHHSASEIKAELTEKYYAQGCVNIIFDFSSLTFMDSAGVGMLIGRYKQVCINGGSLYAAGLSPSVERIFYLSGLNKIIKRFDCAAAALSFNEQKKEVI